MADDGQIRIGLSIDTSGLSGAQSQAQQSADQIAAAYQKVAAAAVQLQVANRNITQDNQSLKSGMLDATTATNVLTADLRTQAVAAANLKAAKAELAAATANEVAAVGEEAAVTEQGTQAFVRNISARQTAAASIGILEGRMMSGNRAAAAFLTTTLGLGPALQMAFPIIGLVALGEVAFEVGKKLYDAFDMGGERARKTAEDIREATDSLRRMNDELSVEIDKITIANEKLEHVPTNGMKLAIDEAILDADRLNDKLDGSLKRIGAALKEMAASGPQQFLGLGSGTDYEQTMLQQHEKYLSQATSLQDQLNESLSYETSLRTRLVDLGNRQALAIQQSEGIPLNYQNEIAAVNTLLQAREKEQAVIKSTMDLQDAQATHQKASDNADAGRLANEANRKTLEGFRTYAAEQEALRGKNAGADYIFWRSKIDAFREGSSEYLAVLDQANRAQEAVLKQFNEKGKIGKELFKRDAEDKKQGTEPPAGIITSLEPKETEAQANERINRTIQDQIQLRERNYQAAVRQSDFMQKLGAITPKQAAAEKLAASHTEENADVSQLQGQQKAIAPLGPANLDETQLAEWKKLQDQITAVQQKASQERIQIQQQETLRMVAAWQQAYQQMTSAVISATNTWMTTHKSFANSFIDAGKHLTVEFIDDLIKQGLKVAEQEAIKFAIHEGWIKATSQADAQAKTQAQAQAAQQAAAQILTNAAQAQSAAGLAEAQAAASAAVGGPLAAAAAGAAMAAAMQPFVLAASAEGGGIIPGRQGQAVPILAHGEELMIPAPLSNLLASAANNGNGAGGGGHHFHSTYAPQISVMDGRGIEGLSRRGAESNFAAMKRQARRVNATN